MLPRGCAARSSRCRHKTGAAHLGSSLSCCDIVAAAYWHAVQIDPKRPTDPLRDRFILSKGHAATTLYAALAFKGFFPVDLLETYCQDGGKLAEHPPANLLPGVEAATGSLGHGLPIGCGMALAGRIRGRDIPCVRAALRRREQRRIGVGSGDVCRRAEARKASASSSTTTSGKRPRARTKP